MARSANKTRPTTASVSGFLDSIGDEDRRRDCRAVAELLEAVSGEAPTMWGDSIVGYGKYRYKYDSGREGEFFRIGFSPRKQAITVYIMPGYANYGGILAGLGKFRKGRSCLYIKQLADVDIAVLERLVRAGWEDMLRMYPI